MGSFLSSIDQYKKPVYGTVGSVRGGILTILLVPAIVIYFAIYVNNVTTGASVETVTTLETTPAHNPNGNSLAFKDMLCFAANGCYVNNVHGECTFYSTGQYLSGRDLEMAATTDPINTFQVLWKLNDGNMGLSYGTETVKDLYTGDTDTKASGGTSDMTSFKVYRGSNFANVVITEYPDKYKVSSWSIANTARDGTPDYQNNNCCNGGSFVSNADCQLTSGGSAYYSATIAMFPTYTNVEIIDPWLNFISLLGGFISILMSFLGLINFGCEKLCGKKGSEDSGHAAVPSAKPHAVVNTVKPISAAVGGNIDGKRNAEDLEMSLT